ncbi:circadian locomoter output cycles protein kaput-like isoform X4 [Sipha flava]|uniref:Circadian locomoter output cycles protein kaput-like isoform X4 n=1 Tax=Sipha flava TaxID=143950 RepID=A0A8B8FDG3_9HEMI|nr:circadian locomoter output cycles protein kaput-like isoform X4 [Sipha flava]
MMFSGVEYTTTAGTVGSLQLQSQHHPSDAAVNNQSCVAETSNFGHHLHSDHLLQYQDYNRLHHYNRYQYFAEASQPSTMVTTPAAALLPSPPDENDFYGTFFQHDNNSNDEDLYRSTASSLLSPSSSSSSSSASASSCAPPYRQVFLPTQQTHDCYGVPAHPSIVDYQPHVTDYHPPPVTDFPLTVNYRSPPVSDFQRPHQHYYRDFCAQQPLSVYHNKDSASSYDHNGPELSTAATTAAVTVTNVPATVKSPNSSRQMRNQAEKLRRSKLNTCINELSQLVPLISNSPKKIEKTSVLRLSAAYLRLSRLLAGFKKQREELPAYVREMNLSDLILGDKDIFLMVSSAGKIVFVSHTVENILGHHQTDLMGQSIFKIACPEDYEQIRDNLKYQENTSSEDGLQSTKLEGSGNKMQRRSFYMRLIKKTASRTDPPEYKLVHVMGTLMQNNDSSLGGNDFVLNAIIRPYNDFRVTEISLLEATKEEYITRHQIDGRIIYVDHRISIVSGFMPQEVCGKLAFMYMHKDDVRWVMIALRQMYYKGQSFGSSCYRLLSKNGDFVYMKTHGYLELNINDETIASFICINTRVSTEEGEKEIIKMRERFTPLISKPEPGIAAITNNQYMAKDSTTSLKNASTEDPSTLNKAVQQMYTNIPAPALDSVKESAQNPLPDSQYIKVVLLSKSMPPVQTDSNTPKIDKRSSMSPQPNIKPLIQDRPTVLQIAPHAPRLPVVIDQKSSEKTIEKDTEYFKQRGGVLVNNKRQNEYQLIPDHLPKTPKIETQIDSPTCSQYSHQMDGSQSDNQLSTDGYGSLEDFSSFQSTPIQLGMHCIDEQDTDLDSFNDVNITGFDNFSKTLEDQSDLIDPSMDPLFLTPESFNSFDNGVYMEGNSTDIIPDPIMHVLQHDGCSQSELLKKNQITLKSKMDQQHGQLKEIQKGLNSLSSNADTHYIAKNFTNLKAVHEKQNQYLRTLQEVHKNIVVNVLMFK